MSRQLSELEELLQQLVSEHRKLIKHADSHQAAMKKMDLKAMDDAANQQEAGRLRIATAETKRRALANLIARQHNMAPNPTISQIAEVYPHRRAELLAIRDQLRLAIGELSTRTHITGRLAGAVLGHLNTVVRLLAGALERAGLYTRQGIPKVSARIGVMDAVG